MATETDFQEFFNRTGQFEVASSSYETAMDEFEENSATPQGMTIGDFFRQAARYYVAGVILFGVIGNLGCLICYRRSNEVKKLRSTGYLMALAISDLTFLVCLSLIWLKSIGINWHDAQVVCQTSVYASNASIFLSAWYVMALTGEMAFALRRPYRAYMAAMDASKTVIIRIFIVTGIGLGVNSWTLALTKTGTMVFVEESDTEQVQVMENQLEYEEPNGSGVDPISIYEDPDLIPYFWENITDYMPHPTFEAGCHISSNKLLLHRTFVLLDVVFTYCVPLVVTLCLNCYIGYKIIQAGRQRRHMSQRGLIDNRSGSGLHTNQMSMTQVIRRESYNRRRRPAQQLERCPFTARELNRMNSCAKRKVSSARGQATRNKEAAVSSLLIAKSMAYLIFNSPSCAHRIWSMLKREAAVAAPDGEPQMGGSEGKQSWLYTVIYMLFFTQFSINFLLYSWHAYSRRRCRVRAVKAILRPYHSPGRYL